MAELSKENSFFAIQFFIYGVRPHVKWREPREPDKQQFSPIFRLIYRKSANFIFAHVIDFFISPIFDVII